MYVFGLDLTKGTQKTRAILAKNCLKAEDYEDFSERKRWYKKCYNANYTLFEIYFNSLILFSFNEVL